MIAQAEAWMRELGIDGSKQNKAESFNLPVALLESQCREGEERIHNL